jgi:hypothetical protein
MADTENLRLFDTYLHTLAGIAAAAHAHTRLDNRRTHAINRIDVIPPSGINWYCQCGNHGTCPRPIALYVLVTHLNQDAP